MYAAAVIIMAQMTFRPTNEITPLTMLLKRSSILALLLIFGLTGCSDLTAPEAELEPALTSTPTASHARTTVPGHTGRFDKDDNGFPDEGKFVNGHYTSLYAYDEGGDWYQDLGDGRVRGTVGSVDDLDQSTLTTCDYVVNYRADFGNDPFMDAGWIQNHIKCSGYSKGSYQSLIVSDTDPRYTGDPDLAIWGNWEYVVDTISGQGNIAKSARPQNHVGS